MPMDERDLVDQLDRDIITLLQKDGRMPTVAMGRTLGVSETTIRKRLDRLQELDIIRVGATVEPFALGYRTMALVGLEVELPHVQDVARALAAMQETRYVALSTGQYDVIIEVVLRTDQELLAFLTEHVANVPHVRRMETFLTPEIMKFSDQWWLPTIVDEVGNGARTLTKSRERRTRRTTAGIRGRLPQVRRETVDDVHKT